MLVHACVFVLHVCASLCGAGESLFTLQLSSGAHLVRRKFLGVSYARGMRETAACVRVLHNVSHRILDFAFCACE